MATSLSGAPAELRSVIKAFLQERLVGKVEKLAVDDPKREALEAQFQFEAWIDDAARRVGQIQLVTHSLKAIHPDAKGTNLYAPPYSLTPHAVVGSHCLSDDFAGDVVGNAAALDVYKFLKLEHGSRTVLDRALEGDDDLAKALSEDEQQARRWMQAFAGITQARGENASHTKAKQLYWLVGDDPTRDSDYHVLAPLYATSLAHRVFQTINENRFGDAAKEARKARREKQDFAHGYYDYPNLAVQKLGGTKPQNISQLNSERGGTNYLLASLPPSWKSREIWEPLNTESVFPRFGRRPQVRQLTSELRRFLESDPAKTMATRDQRDELSDVLIDELFQFAAELEDLGSGWSVKPECRLNEAEKLWLDPGRAEQDEEFRRKRQLSDWAQEVRNRFANWLNSALKGRLPMGDIEHRHWSTELGGDAAWARCLDADRRWLARLDKQLNALQEDLHHD